MLAYIMVEKDEFNNSEKFLQTYFTYLLYIIVFL